MYVRICICVYESTYVYVNGVGANTSPLFNRLFYCYFLHNYVCKLRITIHIITAIQCEAAVFNVIWS